MEIRVVIVAKEVLEIFHSPIICELSNFGALQSHSSHEVHRIIHRMKFSSLGI